MSHTPRAKPAGSNSVRRISSGQSVMMATRQLQTKATICSGCAVLIGAEMFGLRNAGLAFDVDQDQIVMTAPELG